MLFLRNSPVRALPPATVVLCGLMAALLASPALAGSIRYDIAPGSGDPFKHGLGISQSVAESAGIPIFGTVDDELFTVIDDLDPSNSSLRLETSVASFNLVDETVPATAVQSWEVTNQSGRDQPSSLVLVFQRPLDNEIFVNGQTETFEYELGEVSLNLSNGADWIILRVDDADNDETWYYPAVRLGELEDGASIPSPFEMDMTLDNPEIFERIDQEFVLGLPDWQVRAAFFVIPEPSTGLLVALGCALLALGPPRST